jgi:hypothetical protein
MMEGTQRRLFALHLVDLESLLLSEEHKAKIGAKELINYITL